ncbi:MAG: hypothetical protein RRE78_06020 [Acidianus sp.]|jgi:hypothetical protein|nr:hypothetical protein [Acidianus sp.]
MDKLMLFTIAFLLLGIFMSFFTFLYSNSIVYCNHFKISLSDRGGISIPYKGSTGDEVVLLGYSNSTIKVLELNPPGGAILLGSFKGNFSKTFTALTFKCITFEGCNCPASVSAKIIVYNTSFSPIGYTIAGIFIFLGLIFLGYYKALSKSRNIKVNRSKSQL